MPFHKKDEKKLRNQNLTVPNAMSLFRILVIPFFAVFFLQGNLTAAIVTLALSGLSDALDGMVARKFNQITELGKMLDPLADKLTQGTLFLCIALNHPLMWVLLVIWLLKDGFMAIMGLVLLKAKQTKLDGARWYGKVCTAIIYIAVLALLFFPGVFPPESKASIVLILICIGIMLLSGILYSIPLIKMWIHNETIAKENRKKLREMAKESTQECVEAEKEE